MCCLLYTSDAADEGLGVDLGGRRIIKKNSIGVEDDVKKALPFSPCSPCPKDHHMKLTPVT